MKYLLPATLPALLVFTAQAATAPIPMSRAEYNKVHAKAAPVMPMAKPLGIAKAQMAVNANLKTAVQANALVTDAPDITSLEAAQASVPESLAAPVAAQTVESDTPKEKTPTGSYLIVSAVGDVMLGTNYPVDKLPSDGGKSLFQSSETYIKAADIRFGNFEDSLYNGGTNADGKSPGANRWLFRTPPEMGRLLPMAGFNVMSLANNHAHDFGRDGVNSTKTSFHQMNVNFSSKDGEVAKFNVRGQKVALIAADFLPGSRSLVNPAATLEEIRDLKKQFHFVIVSCHAGAEGGAAMHVSPGPEFFLGENRGDSVTFAHDAIDAGADLVLMHGPHVPRGMEVYKTHLIAYSLGNFATGPGISIQEEAGVAPLLRVQMDEQGRFVQGHLASFMQTRAQGTVYDPSGKAYDLVKNLSREDFPKTAPHFDGNGFIHP